MKEFTIGKNDAGQRLDRWLGKTVPLLPAGLAQKYIRIKRVKLNGKGAKRDTRLQAGDLLQLYINDEFFDTPAPENAFLKLFKPKLDILLSLIHISTTENGRCAPWCLRRSAGYKHSKSQPPRTM